MDGLYGLPSGKLAWLAGKWTWIESMYSLFENGIFQPAMLVYRRVEEQKKKLSFACLCQRRSPKKLCLCVGLSVALFQHSLRSENSPNQPFSQISSAKMLMYFPNCHPTHIAQSLQFILTLYLFLTLRSQN